MSDRFENAIAISIVALVIIGAVYFLGDAPAQAPREGSREPIRPEPISIDDDPMLGEFDAPVTIIVFSDYASPAGRRLDEQRRTLQPLIDEGTLRYIHRDYPLTVEGRLAAEAAGCAGDDFWEFHEALYDAGGNVTLTLAESAGLDVEAFTACVEERRSKEEVARDIADAERARIAAVPTLFINGRRITGVPSMEELRATIEEERAQTI